jgi:hypothetical protein
MLTMNEEGAIMHSSNLSTPKLQDNRRTAALSIQEVSRQIFEQSYIQDQDIRFQHTLSIINWKLTTMRPRRLFL